MNIGAASCCVYTQLPTQRCPGCFSCFARILDLLAKKLLEVLEVLGAVLGDPSYNG